MHLPLFNLEMLTKNDRRNVAAVVNSHSLCVNIPHCKDQDLGSDL